ncbi:MAG TPA: DUF2207 domain-containing protein, partial [Cellulomonas sp.]|nr:DUF2207 domain-containing protein [Cellulomonas sp.]
VAIDLSLDFADTPGHGPYLTVVEREQTDDGRTRVYSIDDVTASSPSNAPADVDVQDDGDQVQIRIGDPDVDDVDGVQQYHVEYTVTGLIDSDELSWDPIGPDWELPLSDISVTVAGPVPPEQSRCFAGEVGSTASCSSSSVTDSGAQFSQDALSPGEALTVVAGWPAGTFPWAAAVFGDSDDAWTEEGLPEGPLELDENGNPPSFVQQPDGTWVQQSSSSVTGFGGVTALAVVVGLAILGAIVAVVILVARNASRPRTPPAEVLSLAEHGYVRLDPIPAVRPDDRPNWMVVPLRPMGSGLTRRERAWYGAMFAAGMAPVYWSQVRAPIAEPERSGFGTGDGWGGGGVGGGDGGGGSAGGGDGGGGGGSW